jgi:hypothetical protein
MLSITDYQETIKLLLSEGGKYLLLLIFVVLSIRLWKRFPRASGVNRQQTLLLSVVASIAACAIGLLSMRHSLGRLYAAYGLRAFDQGNILAAAGLFHQSQGYWQDADTIGKEGVCRLLLELPNGPALLDEAKARRKGASSGFESHYTGLYYLFHEQPEKAFPFLRASAAELHFRWVDLKLLALILLEKNQPADAAQLMAPFAQVQITDFDHAYVMASLKVVENKPLEARALLERFQPETLPEFWKARFERLMSKTRQLTS